VPGIAEKGFLNVLVEVSSPGGHSSVPPRHTVRVQLPFLPWAISLLTFEYGISQSIGILSALLVHFERNPIPVHLVRPSSHMPLRRLPNPSRYIDQG